MARNPVVTNAMEQHTRLALDAVDAALSGATTNTFLHFAGSLLLCAFVGFGLSFPELLPRAFLLFLCVSFPYRTWSFTKRKWTFFLFDYCYFANFAVAGFLLWALHFQPEHHAGRFSQMSAQVHIFPHTHESILVENMSQPGPHPHPSAPVLLTPELGSCPSTSSTIYLGIQAAVYVLSEGPLAAALLAWRCAWVPGSPDHIISVLIHLLPGLALWAHRWGGAGKGFGCCAGDQGFWQLAPSFASNQHRPASTSQPLLWLIVAPLVFYCSWQLFYYLIVQVLFRKFIKKHGYDTSYNAMARRAQKSKRGSLNRFVRRGSTARRICIYGALQLFYTMVTGVIGVLAYCSPCFSLMWQVIKFLGPLYYGSNHACRLGPRQSVRVALLALTSKIQEHCVAHPSSCDLDEQPTARGSTQTAADVAAPDAALERAVGGNKVVLTGSEDGDENEGEDDEFVDVFDEYEAEGLDGLGTVLSGPDAAAATGAAIFEQAADLFLGGKEGGGGVKGTEPLSTAKSHTDAQQQQSQYAHPSVIHLHATALGGSHNHQHHLSFGQGEGPASAQLTYPDDSREARGGHPAPAGCHDTYASALIGLPGEGRKVEAGLGNQGMEDREKGKEKWEKGGVCEKAGHRQGSGVGDSWNAGILSHAALSAWAHSIEVAVKKKRY